MIKLRLIILATLLANAAQAETDVTLSAIEAEVGKLAEEVRTNVVPQMLTKSLQASSNNVR